LTFNRPPRCEAHAECAERHLGPSICQASRCVALTNYDPLAADPERRGDCRVLVGAENLSEGLEPLLFGAFAVVDPTTPESSLPILNYKLAVQEISNQGGIPIVGESRLPVAVVCNSNVTSARIERSFDHLVDTLGVSAVIAGITDVAELKSSFEHVQQKPRDVFFLSPFASSNLLTSIRDNDLLWHLLPNVLEVAPTYLPLVTRVEDHINPAPASGPRAAIRVALVIASDFTKLAELGEFLDKNLHFNGSAARENAQDRYLRVSVNYDTTNPDADLSEQLRSLQAFRPNIVVSAAGNELLKKIVPELEQGWPASEPARPFYVLSPYQISDALYGLAQYEGSYRLRERLVGVNFAAAADSTSYDDYLARLKLQFPDRRGLESTENYYDAPYLLLYAAAAGAISRDFTGADVARGMRRLLSGMPYNVGPKDLVNALRYLEDDPQRTIALQGTLGPPDFDANGGRRGTGSVWCVEESQAPPAWQIHFDALRYNPEQATLEGTLPCLAGF
jgi:hypothetical protein